MVDRINHISTEPREPGSSAGIAFIVGVLAVVVGVLAFIVFGDFDDNTAGGVGDSVNVNIEDNRDTAAPQETAPVAEPEAAPAPEEAAPEQTAPQDN